MVAKCRGPLFHHPKPSTSQQELKFSALVGLAFAIRKGWVERSQSGVRYQHLVGIHSVYWAVWARRPGQRNTRNCSDIAHHILPSSPSFCLCLPPPHCVSFSFWRCSAEEVRRVCPPLCALCGPQVSVNVMCRRVCVAGVVLNRTSFVIGADFRSCSFSLGHSHFSSSSSGPLPMSLFLLYQVSLLPGFSELTKTTSCVLVRSSSSVSTSVSQVCFSSFLVCAICSSAASFQSPLSCGTTDRDCNEAKYLQQKVSTDATPTEEDQKLHLWSVRDEAN